MQTPIQPIILCGGSGTRLWPLSRAEFPKQFLRLHGLDSLFQLSLQRLQVSTAALASEGQSAGGVRGSAVESGARVGLSQDAAPIIVSNEDHRFLVRDQMKEAGVVPKAILLEPVGRNTAPALAFAAHAAAAEGDDPILIVTPADQVVLEVEKFRVAMAEAVRAAETGAVVLLGIVPDRPETAYGYIRTSGAGAVREVVAFVEKPDIAKAQEYLSVGGYFWNSGIFVLRASVWQQALAQFRPDIASKVAEAWGLRTPDQEFIRPGREAFLTTPSESIDYAVMEKCIGMVPVVMVPLDAGWSDLGSWDAVWQTAKKDAAGNSAVGDVLLRDSKNVLVHAESRLVSVVGLEDVVVIETPDAVMVTDRARSQDVKNVVNALSSASREEHAQHRKVHRPWGWYDSVDQGPRFKVKRIMVNPGASLSLQKHHHRAEHWVVVCGTAKVECGDKTLLLHENQSTYIPLGEVHRLSNPGMIPLEIIEVQSGEYLGEDDIVRLEDNYGRKQS